MVRPLIFIKFPELTFLKNRLKTKGQFQNSIIFNNLRKSLDMILKTTDEIHNLTSNTQRTLKISFLLNRWLL